MRAHRVALAVWLVAVACARAPVPPPQPVAAPPAVASPAPPPPPAAEPSGASPEDLARVPPPPEPPPPAGAVGAGEGWVEPGSAATTPGYRVQIFASSEPARAEEVAAAARRQFAEPVYVTYEAPLYKVRVGDCVARYEADALKERAIAYGFDGPWVVETTVQAR